MDTQESSITYVVNPAIYPYHLAIKESPNGALISFYAFINHPYTHILFFFTFLSYWSIADYQCCDDFRWTAKGLSHAYPCTHSPWHSPSNKATTSHWAEFPVPYSRSLLVIHFKYSSYTYVLNQRIIFCFRASLFSVVYSVCSAKAFCACAHRGGTE